VEVEKAYRNTLILAFLKNKTVNFVNIHSGIIALAEALIGIFIGVYLLQAGLFIWQIMFVWCLIFIVRLIFRPLTLHLIHRFGLRRVIILGTFNFLPIYAILSQVSGLDGWLAAYIIYYAINDTLYWLPFHTYFAAIGSNNDRGRHLSVREAFTTLAGIIGPLLSAFIISFAGFQSVFSLAGGIAVLGMLPLFFTPDIDRPTYISVKDAWQSVDRRGFVFFLGYGWIFMGSFVIWSLIVFEVAGDLLVFGGLFTLAAFAQMIGGFAAGHFIDAGHTKLLYRLAILAVFIMPLVRALFSTSVPAIVVLEICIAIALGFVLPILNTVFYNLSRNSSNSLYFQYFAETGWDVGSIIITVIAAGISYFGFDLRWGIAATVLGVPIVAYILWQYYEVEHHSLISKS